MSTNILRTVCSFDESPYAIQRSLENHNWICKVVKIYSAPILEPFNQPSKNIIVFLEIIYANTQGAELFKKRLMRSSQEEVYKLDRYGAQIPFEFDEFCNPKSYDKWIVYKSSIDDIKNWETKIEGKLHIWAETEPEPILKLMEPVTPPVLKHNSPISIQTPKTQQLSLLLPTLQQENPVTQSEIDTYMRELFGIMEPIENKKFYENVGERLTKIELDSLRRGEYICESIDSSSIDSSFNKNIIIVQMKTINFKKIIKINILYLHNEFV
jgi:hypothetical protein